MKDVFKIYIIEKLFPILLSWGSLWYSFLLPRKFGSLFNRVFTHSFMTGLTKRVFLE